MLLSIAVSILILRFLGPWFDEQAYSPEAQRRWKEHQQNRSSRITRENGCSKKPDLGLWNVFPRDMCRAEQERQEFIRCSELNRQDKRRDP